MQLTNTQSTALKEIEKWYNQCDKERQEKKNYSSTNYFSHVNMKKNLLATGQPFGQIFSLEENLIQNLSIVKVFKFGCVSNLPTVLTSTK